MAKPGTTIVMPLTIALLYRGIYQLPFAQNRQPVTGRRWPCDARSALVQIVEGSAHRTVNPKDLIGVQRKTAGRRLSLVHPGPVPVWPVYQGIGGG